MDINILLIDGSLEKTEKLIPSAEIIGKATIIRALTFSEGKEQLTKKPFDFLLLDMETISNDTEIVRRFRSEYPIPLFVFCTGMTNDEKSVLVDAGADLCFDRPISVVELTMRFKSFIRIVRRKMEEGVYALGDLQVCLQSQTVTKNGVLVPITRTEFKIIRLLLIMPHWFVSKEDLHHYVWNYKCSDKGNVVNVHVRRLRLKIEDDPDHPRIIVTRQGRGFALGIAPMYIDAK